MPTYPVEVGPGPDHPELRAIFSWQTAAGLGPKVGYENVSWYQRIHMAVLREIELRLSRYGFQKARVSYSRDGYITARADGRTTDLGTVNEIYLFAEENAMWASRGARRHE